jgi:hypothetical protein
MERIFLLGIGLVFTAALMICCSQPYFQWVNNEGGWQLFSHLLWVNSQYKVEGNLNIQSPEIKEIARNAFCLLCIGGGMLSSIALYWITYLIGIIAFIIMALLAAIYVGQIVAYLLVPILAAIAIFLILNHMSNGKYMRKLVLKYPKQAEWFNNQPIVIICRKNNKASA